MLLPKLLSIGSEPAGRSEPTIKSFLLPFFKKEDLSSLLIVTCSIQTFPNPAIDPPAPPPAGHGLDIPILQPSQGEFSAFLLNASAIRNFIRSGAWHPVAEAGRIKAGRGMRDRCRTGRRLNCTYPHPIAAPAPSRISAICACSKQVWHGGRTW